MSYWLIAVPFEGDLPGNELERLRNETERKGLSRNMELAVPSLKVGTLDSLMALSEDLAKSDPMCDQIAKKLEKANYEIHKTDEAEDRAKTKTSKGQSSSSSSSSSQHQDIPELTVALGNRQVSSRVYVEQFHWDEHRYNKRTALKQLSESIVKEALKVDETLRKTQSEFAETRQQYASIERLESGSLLVRPLTSYIKPGDLIEGKEYLTTILVVVPRARKDEFEQNYMIFEDQQNELEAKKAKERAAASAAQQAAKGKAEANTETGKNEEKVTGAVTVLGTEENASSSSSSSSSSSAASSSSESSKKDDDEDSHRANKKLPCKAVVPRSAKLLCDIAGEEYLLYRVVVLKQGAENYKNILREKRFVIRQYKHDAEEESRKSEQKSELEKQKKRQKNFLIQYTATHWSEVFSSWIHLKVIRLFVESVLRYGLPVKFTAVILEPVKGREKQLRQQLRALYSKLAGDNANLTAPLDQSEMDPSGLGEDFYPYVYLPLNLLD